MTRGNIEKYNFLIDAEAGTVGADGHKHTPLIGPKLRRRGEPEWLEAGQAVRFNLRSAVTARFPCQWKRWLAPDRTRVSDPESGGGDATSEG